MATQITNCILCKEAHSEEVPFMEIQPDCLCCSETKRIHIRCAKMHNQLHESLIKKFMPGYVMCRVCTKYLNPSINTYAQGDDTISISLELCDPYYGWRPNEYQRTEAMRQSGHKSNICIKYASKNNGISKYEIWYHSVSTVTIKPLLMRYWHTNNRNLKHGENAQYYTNGKLEYICNLSNGHYHGEYRKYFMNGNINSILNYVNHSQTGPVIVYFEDGKLREKYNMANGVKNGLYEEWFNDEKKKTEWHYVNGTHDFTKKLSSWYYNGKIQTEYLPLDSKIIRNSSYYSNGQKEFEVKCIYDNSYINKLKPIEYPYNEYHLNETIRKTCKKITEDKIQVETFFTNGKKMEVYYTNGNGHKHGIYMSWYQLGGREILCMYRRGHQIDEYAKWDSDGTIQKFGRYDREGRFSHVTLGV